MATNANVTKTYAKAVFMDHTRTIDSIPYANYRQSVQEYAAGVYLDASGSVVPSGYYVETIDEALAAGTINQAQHDYILGLNPNMLHRPVAAAVADPTTPA